MKKYPPLLIITKPLGIHPFNAEWLKYYAAKITNKRRGPEMVANNLSRGLAELNIPHALNPLLIPFFTSKSAIVHVVSGARTLQWALKLKQAGKIARLIAGPAISVIPADHDSILENPLIDTIVFPGQWTKDFFSSINPYFKNKIEVWPAGVSSNVNVSGRKNGRGIVYFKFASVEIREVIKANLAEKNTAFDTFEYGNFQQADYFAALEKADWMIYLSPSESQGIALQEAWIRDVPTLVWSPGVWNYQAAPDAEKYSWSDPLISAPYLTAESGMSFAQADDFHAAFDAFMGKLQSFAPRAYCMKKLTDRESAARFLEIIAQK